jgi:hypothetical protein
MVLQLVLHLIISFDGNYNIDIIVIKMKYIFIIILVWFVICNLKSICGEQ